MEGVVEIPFAGLGNGGEVAQLVRVSVCQTESRGFESRLSRHGSTWG